MPSKFRVQKWPTTYFIHMPKWIIYVSSETPKGQFVFLQPPTTIAFQSMEWTLNFLFHHLRPLGSLKYLRLKLVVYVDQSTSQGEGTCWSWVHCKHPAPVSSYNYIFYICVVIIVIHMMWFKLPTAIKGVIHSTISGWSYPYRWWDWKRSRYPNYN